MPQGDIETFHIDGKWHNAIEGTVDQVSEPFDTMDEAVEEGREMARESGVDHVVKNLDGTIAERHSYGDRSRQDGN